MGDTVPRPEDGTIAVWARAVDAARMSLEFHGAEGCLHQCDIDSADQRVEVTLPVGESPYVRAQLVTPGASPTQVRAITNPIYLR